jgi:hypothetical protein
MFFVLPGIPRLVELFGPRRSAVRAPLRSSPDIHVRSFGRFDATLSRVENIPTSPLPSPGTGDPEARLRPRRSTIQFCH